MSLIPAPSLILTRDLGAVVSPTAVLRRGVRSGSLVRLHRGVYLPSREWQTLGADARYCARVRAAVATSGDCPVISHYSAAALWGLPIIGPWPTDVHLLTERASGGRSDPGIRRHALGVTSDDFVTVDGLRVTTLARTVLDFAATAPLYTAVATADAAIHVPRFGDGARLTKDDLYAEWDRMMPFRGYARSRRVIDFAETASGSTSESASRVTVAVLGFSAPELQRVYRVNGRDIPVDFYFEEVDGIGECDGTAKYTDPALRGGRTAEEVVIDEKLREDALRRQSSAFTRWGSAEAMSPRLLRVNLLELGLRQGPARIRGR